MQEAEPGFITELNSLKSGRKDPPLVIGRDGVVSGGKGQIPEKLSVDEYNMARTMAKLTPEERLILQDQHRQRRIE